MYIKLTDSRGSAVRVNTDLVGSYRTDHNKDPKPDGSYVYVQGKKYCVVETVEQLDAIFFPKEVVQEDAKEAE